MNRFFVLRGAPGCGKSTWVRDNGLEYFTVSSDEFRLAMFGTVADDRGIERISQEHPEKVWNAIHNEIAYRFSKGDDVVLDSTALKTGDMNEYDGLVYEYGYDAYVVDFTSVPKDVCKERNASREEMRVVPEFVIDRFYDKVKDNPVPDFYVVLTPDECIDVL